MRHQQVQSTKRKRKAGCRRRCQGVCYSAPILTDQDQQWEGEGSQAVLSASTSTLPSQVAHVRKSDATQSKPNSAQAAKKRRPDSTGSASRKRGQLSTAVGLLPAALPRQPAVYQSEKPRDFAAAFAGYPDSIYQYMKKSSFHEPTPVQRR